MTPTTEPPLSAPRHPRQGTGGFDLFNPFGTSVLWPFASRRFGLGWLYVLDPVVTGLVAVALALSWWSTVCRYALPRWAFGMRAAYALVAGVLGRVGDTQWRAFLADRGIAASRVAVIPTFPGPLRWVGVAEAEHALYRAAFWIARPSNPTLTTFPKGATDALAGLHRTAEVRTFLAFARFPWLTVTTEGDLRGRVLGPRVSRPPPRRTDGPPDHRRPVWRGAWR